MDWREVFITLAIVNPDNRQEIVTLNWKENSSKKSNRSWYLTQEYGINLRPGNVAN